MQYGENGGAVGYLVGAENQGLDIMFGMMNHARLAVGLQGLSISDRAYQKARAYSFDRVQEPHWRRNLAHQLCIIQMFSAVSP